MCLPDRIWLQAVGSGPLTMNDQSHNIAFAIWRIWLDFDKLMINKHYDSHDPSASLWKNQPYAFLNLKSPPGLAAEEAAMFYFTPCFELV